MHCGPLQVNHSTYTSDLPPLLMQLIHIAFLLQWHYQQVRSFLCHSYTTIDHCKSASVVDVSSRWWRLTYSEAMQGLFSTRTVSTHPHMATIITINIHHHNSHQNYNTITHVCSCMVIMYIHLSLLLPMYELFSWDIYTVQIIWYMHL